jgi:thiol:disulfide interchange protein DsbD
MIPMILAALLFAAEEPVTWSIGGSALRAEVTAVIQPGWHIYSTSQPDGGPVATRIWLAEDQAWKAVGGLSAPKPEARFDPAFGMTVETHRGRAEFSIPVRGGGGPLRVHAHFQCCNLRECLPPRTVTLERPALGRAARMR